MRLLNTFFIWKNDASEEYAAIELVVLSWFSSSAWGTLPLCFN